jgi:hypothetical protein
MVLVLITNTKNYRAYFLGDYFIKKDFYNNYRIIVPSGVYYGFYYHSVDEPIGFQGESVPLTKDGQGWSWRQSEGDNWYYTEKIADNWYYYEAGF